MPVLFLTSFSALVLSFVSKLLADGILRTVPGGQLTVLGSFLGFQYSENPGIAFGFRLPPALQPLLIALALVLVLILALRTRTRLSQIGFGCIIGGALANILDRLRDGMVTDFFKIGAFPLFNVADSAITIGAALLLLEALWLTRERMEAGKER